MRDESARQLSGREVRGVLVTLVVFVSATAVSIGFAVWLLAGGHP